MKKAILTVLPLCVFLFASAQYIPGRKEISHYIFPEFIQGTVLKKSGEVITTLLNYNSLTEEMIFMHGSQPLAVDESEKIDTVVIAERRFVPVGKVFHEVVTSTLIPFFIQHKSTLVPPGKNAGYGTSSQTSSITSITSILGPGRAYQLALPENYKVLPRTTYWLRKNDKLVKAENLKELLAVFPEKASQIRQYIKEHKLDFEKPEDVTRIVLFSQGG